MSITFLPIKPLSVFVPSLVMIVMLLSASWPGPAVHARAGAGESVGSSRRPEWAGTSVEPVLTTRDQAALPRVSEVYGKLPLTFEANRGQFDSRVKFVSRGGRHSLFLTSTEAVLVLSKSVSKNKFPNSATRDLAHERAIAERLPTRMAANERPAALGDEPTLESNQPSIVRMKLIGSNLFASAEHIGELPGKSNYFIGNDPKKWVTGISNYSKVRFRSVYRGIDLAYYGDQRNLEYDFNVAPGANPETIKFSFEGSKRARIDANGDLVLMTLDGQEIRHRRPVAYQEKNGKRQQVEARYVMNRRGGVRFSIGRYDRSKELVIDPVLMYSTLIGGSDYDQAFSIAVDSAGNAYITGSTASSDFPLMSALQPLPRSIFIAKLNPSGSAIVYSTYFGGAGGGQSASELAVDSTGNVYVTGRTHDADFPIVNALQSHNGGGFDAFVTKLNSAGSALIYSTYLGGAKEDAGFGIAVDSAGNALVTGQTHSADFPKANALQSGYSGGDGDAFVTKINASGSALIYSTYLGGAAHDQGSGITVDAAGNAYVTGETTSLDFPALNALQPAFAGKTLFKSANRGAKWTSINNGVPSNASVRTIAIDPNATSTVYAGATASGMFKSTDAGTTWKAINSGIPAVSFVTAIVVDPSNSAIVYAANDTGLQGAFKSTDGGATWNATGAAFLSGLALVIDPHTPSTLFLGTLEGVYKSTNGGASWVQGNYPGAGHFPPISCIAIDPANPSLLYTGTSESNEFFRSTDGGIFWGGFSAPSQDSVNAVAIDPMATSVLYAAAGGLYRSTSSGASWTRMSNGLDPTQTTPGTIVNVIAIDSAVPSTVYAGTRNGVFKSKNSGGVWTAMNTGLEVVEVNALAIDPINSSNLYAGALVGPDAFVTAINSTGAAMLHSTYLGGGGYDSAGSIALDAAANIYVTGGTSSSRFSNANPLRQFSGDLDGFAAKLTQGGMSISYLTYIGGHKYNNSMSIAVDGGGSAFVTGYTGSTDFPTTPDALQASFGDCPSLLCFRASLTKINQTGDVTYSTYLGGRTPISPLVGPASDIGYGIAVDAPGNAYLAGTTNTIDFPSTPGAFQTTSNGSGEAWVVKFGSTNQFDACLEDDSRGGVLQINSVSGDYQFTNCQGVTMGGKGAVTIKGCLLTLQANAPDRRVLARLDTCMKTGTASLQLFSQGTTFSITDRNTTNNTCVCTPR